MLQRRALWGLRVHQRLFLLGLFNRQVNSPSLDTQDSHAESSNRPSVPQDASRFSKFSVTNEIPRLKDWELERMRVVPTSSAFYGGNPVHDDNMYKLNAMIKKYKDLPTRVIDIHEANLVKFITLAEYIKLANSGARVKVGHHKALVGALNRLRSIQPELMPTEVSDMLKQFSSTSGDTSKELQKKVKTLDLFGRANTVGKRKTSLAAVSMVKGDGQVMVNGRSFIEYFPRDTDRLKIAFPFKVVSQEGEYNIFVKTSGGGVSGQAEATMYGIAKALVIFNPLLKSRLRSAGLMTRDPRIVERKKPGKVKARKSPTWVKR
ncbi:small subunit ribosomal protein S9 [Metschnikowia aff. pulcherrima]|uniref:Small ribosomal subunit protein uS9m n=1 Tax=Metschnikowia aff. pulcherrima TaxID=2163413 RepID=A0A4P6XRY3_9ASCO|nr:small subunit ribosomal protein S9 [Metschnikowia aff. pulcherrima]